MDTSKLLEQYLFNRGLFNPAQIGQNIIEGQEGAIGGEILSNDDLWEKVSNSWTSNKEAITAVIKARILSNIAELVLKSFPQETIVLRQVILELSQILNDFEKYSSEHLRRVEKKSLQQEDNAGTTAEEQSDYKLE